MSVTIPTELRGKFYALRVLAVALVALAVVAFFLRPNSFGIYSLGLLAILVSAWIVRRSNVYVRRAQGQPGGGWAPAKAVRRVGPLAWALTAASVVACGLFSFFAYVDELHGGREAWPAYALFAAVLALAATSGYMAMKIFR